MIVQLLECWSTTSVHLVTVSVVEWIMIVVDVIVSTIMMMMIVSVSVIEKVHTCTYIRSYIRIFVYVYMARIGKTNQLVTTSEMHLMLRIVDSYVCMYTDVHTHIPSRQ